MYWSRCAMASAYWASPVPSVPLGAAYDALPYALTPPSHELPPHYASYPEACAPPSRYLNVSTTWSRKLSTSSCS